MDPNDTVDSLYMKFMYPEGIKSMAEAVNMVAAGNAPRVPQSEDGASYEAMLNKKELQRVDLSKIKSSEQLHNFIRGMDSAPGAWTLLNNEEVQLFGSSVWDKKIPAGDPVEVDGVKGVIHPGGLYIDIEEGKGVNVERIKIGTKTIPARMYGKAMTNGVKLELDENEKESVEVIKEIWTNILNIPVEEDTDFFASGEFPFFRCFDDRFGYNFFKYYNIYVASGAGSMDVVRLVEEIKDRLEITIENTDVFMAPVFSEFIATVISIQRAGGGSGPKVIEYDGVELDANNFHLRFPRQLFVNGRFINGRCSPLKVINPHDESTICTIESASIEDVDDAVLAAKEAFEHGEWSKISARERGNLLFK